MEKIELYQLVPKYFTERKGDIISDVWDNALTINRGKSYLVKASSGCGKSSFCNFLYGIRGDYNGTLLFDGCDVSCFKIDEWVKCRKYSLSMLFQELRLFSELSVLENIELKNKLTSFKTHSEILNLLDSLKLEGMLNKQVGRLSLGEQQRVAFVRALCQPFDFIFLDEPVSHLDPENGQIMASLLENEAKSQGAGIIVTSVGNNLEIQYDNILCI